MIAMLEELRRNVRFSGAGRALADALLTRLAFLRRWSAIEELIQTLDGAAPQEKKKLPSAPEPSPRAEAGPRRGPVTVNSSGAAAPAGEVERAAAPIRSVAPPAEDLAPRVPARARTAPAEPAQGAPRSAPADEPSETERQPSRPRRRPATQEEQSAAKADPVVRKLMDLFDGAIINIEHDAPTPVEEGD
jgi:hypothetical protein